MDSATTVNVNAQVVEVADVGTLMTLLGEVNSPEKAKRDLAQASLDAAALVADAEQQSKFIHWLFECIFSAPQPGEVLPQAQAEKQQLAAIFLKNRFGRKHYQAASQQSFEQGQEVCLQIIDQLPSYMQWVLSTTGSAGSSPSGTSKKLCDHVSILVGRILNQKVDRICEQAEGEEEQKFQTANTLLTAALHSVIFKGYESIMQERALTAEAVAVKAQILRHANLMLESMVTSEFLRVFQLKDFQWLVDQLAITADAGVLGSGPDLLSLKSRELKLTAQLLDLISLTEIHQFAGAVQSQLINLLKSLVASSSEGQSVPQNIQNAKALLKMMKNLTNLMLAVNNVQSEESCSEQQKLERLQIQAEFFYSLAFTNQAGNPVFLCAQQVYQADDEALEGEKKLSSLAEEVLGNAIGYFKGLLEDPNIWISDMLGWDPSIELPSAENQKVDFEKYLEENVFTEGKTLQLLKTLTETYIMLTKEEIEQWRDEPLQFYSSQKEQANDVKGNYLREKAQQLVASISLRFGQHFEAFCTQIIADLQANESLNGVQIESQLQKDAIYQILMIRLSDQRNIEIQPLIQQIQADLEREAEYALMKARAIRLLAKVSDFDALKNDLTSQDALVNGVMNLYSQQSQRVEQSSGGNVDIHLQMCCLEYLKNFYNDHEFKATKYAHLLPKVLPICNQLIIKYAAEGQAQPGTAGPGTTYENYLVINEVLELYRLIVEKYAGYNAPEHLISSTGGAQQPVGNSIICDLALFLNQFWVQYSTGMAATDGASPQPDSEMEDDDGAKEERERTLILSSIIRIMCHIISKMPFRDIVAESAQQILELALQQAIVSIRLGQGNYVLCEYALTYICSVMRVLSSLQLDGLCQLDADKQKAVQASLQTLITNKDSFESEAFFLALQDISIHCLQNDQQLFVQGFLLHEKGSLLSTNFIDKPGVEELGECDLQQVFDYFKVVLTMVKDDALFGATSSLVLQLIETVLSNSFSNSENMEKEQRVERTAVLVRSVLAPMLSLFMLRDAQASVETLIGLAQRLPFCLEVILFDSESSSIEATQVACLQLLVGVCLTHQGMKEAIKAYLAGLSQSNQSDQIPAVMEKLRLQRDVLSNWIGSEIENKVGGTADANSALTQSHLMTLNTEQDEGLFFECWAEAAGLTEEGGGGAPWANSSPSKNLRPTAKSHLVLSDKPMAEKERDIFLQIKEEIAQM